MTTIEQHAVRPLPPAIRRRINSVRRAIRRYVWMEGLAAVAVWLGLWFWASIAVDWLFEPPRLVRFVILAVAGIGLAAAIFVYILRRAFVALSDSSMALLLERSYPRLNDGLLTTVQLAARPQQGAGFNPQMLAYTTGRASEQIVGARVGKVFDPIPLARKVVVALGLAGMVGVLAYLAPGVLKLWTERNVFLADTMWPRKIYLEAVGFNKDGVAKVAAGANFDLRIRAFRGDTDVAVLPERVEIRARDENGGTNRATMRAIGAAAPLNAPKDVVLQEYSHQFTGLLATTHFDVVGGDAKLRNYTIEVVPNPALKLSLVCVYPKYMYPDYSEPRRVPIEPGNDAVPIPVGATLVVSGAASKPLESIRIEGPSGDAGVKWPNELEANRLGAGHDRFSIEFEPFPNPPRHDAGKAAGVAPSANTDDKNNAAPPWPHDYMLQFTLRDADGIKSHEPVTLSLVAVPDDPPEVKVRLVGTREPVVTAQGRLPIAGNLNDDHGLGKAWWDYSVEPRKVAQSSLSSPQDKKPPTGIKPDGPRAGQLPLGDLSGHPTDYAINEKHPAVVEASKLKLAEGERLSLTVRAQDLCDLGAGPNQGSGETWQIDVVSQADLLNRLDAREVMLRQRFGSIVEEMRETRNLLLKMEFAPPSSGEKKPANPSVTGAEPEDALKPARKLTEAELAAKRLESTLESLQNCHKNTLETGEVAAGVDEICLQLANNRIESEERSVRLEASVSRPLHNIVNDLFPVFESRLVDLQGTVGDVAAAVPRRDAALKQADLILAKMQEVLNHMKAVGDFETDIVQRLQKLLDRQKKLTILTKDQSEESLGAPEKD